MARNRGGDDGPAMEARDGCGGARIAARRAYGDFLGGRAPQPPAGSLTLAALSFHLSYTSRLALTSPLGPWAAWAGAATFGARGEWLRNQLCQSGYELRVRSHRSGAGHRNTEFLASFARFVVQIPKHLDVV